MTQLPIEDLEPEPVPPAAKPRARPSAAAVGEAASEQAAQSFSARERAAEVRARIALSLLAEAGDQDGGARRPGGSRACRRGACPVPRPTTIRADLATAVAGQIERARKVAARCLIPVMAPGRASWTIWGAARPCCCGSAAGSCA